MRFETQPREARSLDPQVGTPIRSNAPRRVAGSNLTGRAARFRGSRSTPSSEASALGSTTRARGRHPSALRPVERGARADRSAERRSVRRRCARRPSLRRSAPSERDLRYGCRMSNVNLSDPCDHVAQTSIRTVKRPAPGCVDCLKIGRSWVHLRECLTCGHVGCCDSSPNKHATGHFRGTHHPIVSSVEPGEDWCWCYVDDRMLG
jgi:hypothetical protein